MASFPPGEIDLVDDEGRQRSQGHGEQPRAVVVSEEGARGTPERQERGGAQGHHRQAVNGETLGVHRLPALVGHHRRRVRAGAEDQGRRSQPEQGAARGEPPRGEVAGAERRERGGAVGDELDDVEGDAAVRAPADLQCARDRFPVKLPRRPGRELRFAHGQEQDAPGEGQHAPLRRGGKDAARPARPGEHERRPGEQRRQPDGRHHARVHPRRQPPGDQRRPDQPTDAGQGDQGERGPPRRRTGRRGAGTFPPPTPSAGPGRRRRRR